MVWILWLQWSYCIFLEALVLSAGENGKYMTTFTCKADFLEVEDDGNFFTEMHIYLVFFGSKAHWIISNYQKISVPMLAHVATIQSATSSVKLFWFE